MQVNKKAVNDGLDILVRYMAPYVSKVLRSYDRDQWWNNVLYEVRFPDQLPQSGTFEELAGSLDAACCFTLIIRRWQDVFKHNLDYNCRTWVNELVGVRNAASHTGYQDMEQPYAERGLDTMALFCKYINPKGAAEIRKIYKDVRSRADKPTVTYAGAAQPKAASARGPLTKGSLLQKVGTDAVQKTTLTRKVTYGGKTEIYPVYKVKLDELYYNDQNDRIATWISRYEAENGADSLSSLDTEGFNEIIEGFIIDSNPDAISKTKKNIELVGQREPGVTLADGRIVDGNRRFTCLRKIQEETDEPVYFETVLMDVDINEDKKQIKLLELAIQHGEEKKVDYDLIDYAIGTYRDIELTGLLTAEEYAASANESVAEVKKRIAVAEMVTEFLEYIHLPEQYYVAREYQVYSLFQEMMAPLKQLSEEDQERLKTVVFNNAMMKALPDQRKFIRDIKGMVKNGTYMDYFDDQAILAEELAEEYDQVEVHSKFDVDQFAEENASITEEMQTSLENALQHTRAEVLKARPSANVRKCTGLLQEIDDRVIAKMEDKEKEKLRKELDDLTAAISNLTEALDD